MGEMVERAAIAIFLQRPGGDWPLTLDESAKVICRKQARAAFESMRHPPREMLDEVIRQLGDSSTSAHWDTMLDEILK
jgi:hypothetical protein